MKRPLTLEQGMYIVGIIAFFVGGPFILLYISKMDSGIYPPCVLYSLLGIYCPGCGGTRAVKALLHGQIIQSLYYHPLVLYTAVIYLVFMLSQTISLLSRGRIKGIHFHYWFLYGALVVTALNFIGKNLLKFAFGVIVF